MLRRLSGRGFVVAADEEEAAYGAEGGGAVDQEEGEVGGGLEKVVGDIARAG